MGQEIVYCSKCQKRILGADFEKGLAFEVGNLVSCSTCAADLLKTLPAGEREKLLARMFRATQARTADAPEPAASAERPGSTRRIPVASPTPGSTSATAPIAITAAVIAVAIVIAAVALSGSSERTPPPAPSAAPKIVEPKR